VGVRSWGGGHRDEGREREGSVVLSKWGGGEIEYWGGVWVWVWGRRNAKGEEGMKKGRGFLGRWG